MTWLRSQSSIEQRATVAIVSTGAVFLAILWAVAATAGAGIVADLLDGRFLAGLGETIRIHSTNNPDHASLKYYVDLAVSAAARAFFLWIVCGSVLIAIQQGSGDVVTTFFSAEGDALSLAIVRIVVFSILVYEVNPGAVEHLASQPSGMLRPPRFMGWFVDLIPMSPGVAGWAARALIATGILAAAGALTRFTTVVSVLLAIYVLGLPQYFGKISHGMHGLLWIAMILSVSPCGSAISVDRVFGFGGNPGRSRAFGLSIRMIWFLFACIYFFPGVWKFVISGWDWALSENLKFKMYSAWRGSDYLPAFRIDQYPVLYQGTALLSMLWEVAFPFLILLRRTRIAALLFGAAFHIGVWEFMRIGPPLIMFAYVAFIDWDMLLARLRGRDPSVSTGAAPGRATRIVGGVVCGLVFLFGITLTNSWPFSIYPTHAGMRGPAVQTVEMDVVLHNGQSVEIDIKSISAVTRQSVDYAVIASPDSTQRNAYLRGLARNWALTHDSTDWKAIEFYRTRRLLDPDTRGDSAISRELLLTVIQ